MILEQTSRNTDIINFIFQSQFTMNMRSLLTVCSYCLAVALVRQRLLTTKSLTWLVAYSLTRLTQFPTRRHVKPQQFKLRKV